MLSTEKNKRNFTSNARQSHKRKPKEQSKVVTSWVEILKLKPHSVNHSGTTASLTRQYWAWYTPGHTVCPSGCQRTLPAHIQVAINQNAPIPFLQGRSPSPRPPSLYTQPGLPHPRCRTRCLLSFMQMGTTLKFLQILVQGLSTPKGVNIPPSFTSTADLLHTTARSWLESTVKTLQRNGLKVDPTESHWWQEGQLSGHSFPSSNTAIFYLTWDILTVISPWPYDVMSHLPANCYRYRNPDNRTPAEMQASATKAGLFWKAKILEVKNAFLLCLVWCIICNAMELILQHRYTLHWAEYNHMEMPIFICFFFKHVANQEKASCRIQKNLA